MNIKELQRRFQDKQLLKVITGINNFDEARVLKILKMADLAEVDLVDICAKPSIVEKAMAQAKYSAICVSSIKVSELALAAEMGVAVIELGNYEALHDEGIFYSEVEVLNLAHQLVQKKNNSLLSVTIPGHLEVAQQVALAERLEAIGVDILQTEGAALVEATSPSALGQIEKARLSLANTMEISKATDRTPIITASGITPDTAKLAIAAGASGIGVGRYVNRLESDVEIYAAIKSLQNALVKDAPAIINI